MKRGWKILILACILLIPAAIYIFLRIFGHNEFTIPVYNADGTIGIFTEDDENGNYPHKMYFSDFYDSMDKPINRSLFENKIVILEFISSNDSINKGNNQLNRIADVFRKENSVCFIRVMEKSFKTNANREVLNKPNRNVHVTYADFQTIEDLTKYRLAIDADYKEKHTLRQFVLVDPEQRMRGYYNMDDFDDIDRLILEVKILLNQKKNV